MMIFFNAPFRSSWLTQCQPKLRKKGICKDLHLASFSAFSISPWLFSRCTLTPCGGLYNGVFLPRQLYVIQIENCYYFFLNVQGRFALPIRDWQASVIKVRLKSLRIRLFCVCDISEARPVF